MFSCSEKSLSDILAINHQATFQQTSFWDFGTTIIGGAAFFGSGGFILWKLVHNLRKRSTTQLQESEFSNLL